MTRFYFLQILKAIVPVLLISLIISCGNNEKKKIYDDNIKLGDWSPHKGGCGGVFFKAQKGPLIIELEKRDLFPDKSKAALRAVFLAPDRQVILDKLISDDLQQSFSGDNQNQRLRISTNVKQPGIYALMITIAYDRYGENTSWRFRTNCEKYVIETSRGHRDAHHDEPIVLHDPEREAQICFLPQAGPFNIKINSLPNGVEPLKIKDAKNSEIAVLTVKNNSVNHTFQDIQSFSAPWSLHLSKAQAIIDIEGVTRWEKNYRSDFFTDYPEGAFWATAIDNWFPICENRWLITPNNLTVYGKPGENCSASFKVHNNGTKPEELKLKLKFPDKGWDVKLSAKQLKLEPGEEKEVILTWDALAHDRTVHLQVVTKDFTSYSTLFARSGKSPVSSPLEMPLVLKPYEHENEQFGYLPAYPGYCQVYFNEKNIPFFRTSNGITLLENGQWENKEFPASIYTPVAGGLTKVAFDSDGDIYGIAMDQNKPVLLHSKDGGNTFVFHSIPGNKPGNSFDIEEFSGHNITVGPPPIMRYTQTHIDKNIFWRRYGDLELILAKKTDKGIEWEDPVLISGYCLGVSSHSGIPSAVVSRGSKIFMVWGEATDPDMNVPGVPVYVTEYDTKTGKLHKPVLTGYGPPANDIHNISTITIDSEGYLHVLSGTHGRPFQYAKSLKPANTQEGWTKPEPIMIAEGNQSTQTYVGLVTAPDNTLHIVFRLWRYNTKYFPNDYFASLAAMSKKPGEAWSGPQLLVVAPLTHYSNYRHRLTIDRKGRLFVSYDYWSTYWFYRNDRKNISRTLIMSPDNGQTWKLADDNDFLPVL